MSNNSSQRVTRDQTVEKQRNRLNNVHEDQLRNNEEKHHVFDDSIHDKKNDNANID